MEKLKAKAADLGCSSFEDDAKKKQWEKKFGTVPVTSMTMEV